MLHAASMLGGLTLIWMALSQQWSSPQAWLIAAGASLMCVLVAMRFGGASAAFARAPKLLAIAAARSGVVARGAIATMRAAASADVTLKPALVRIKTRASRPSEFASFASMISAAPGMAVVETDADGLLVHVLDEDAIDASDLGRLEQSVLSGGGMR